MYNIQENNTYKVTFDLVDEDGTAIADSAVGTFLCTLYYFNDDNPNSDPYHLATINNRYNQNVKNANNVSMTSTSNVTWYMQPEDNVMLSSKEVELHTALFTWYYSSKRNSQDIKFRVKKVLLLYRRVNNGYNMSI